MFCGEGWVYVGVVLFVVYIVVYKIYLVLFVYG